MQLFDRFGETYWLGPPASEPPVGWGASEEVSGWFAAELVVDRFDPSPMSSCGGWSAIDADDQRAKADWIAAQLDAGCLRLWRRVRPIAASTGSPTPAAAAPLLSELYIVERTWISWEVLDPHGEPVSGIAYELDTPDGETRTGVTDAQGRVRESGIAKGTCAIRFTSTAA